MACSTGKDDRGAVRRIGVTGHVGHAPHRPDPGDAILIGGTGVQVAEAAPRCRAWLREGGRGVPGGLADVGAGRGIRGERGAADGQHERVGGRKADLLDRRARRGRRARKRLRVAERAGVAGACDHRDVVSGRSQQYRVHLGRLSLGEEVLPQIPADRNHVGAGDGEPQPGEHARRRALGAALDAGRQQDHPEGGAGGDHVQFLKVPDLPATTPAAIDASQGEVEWARLFTTWIRAAGSRNRLSNLARS